MEDVDVNADQEKDSQGLSSPVPDPGKGRIGDNMEEFDDLLEFVGSNGRYQKLLLYGSLVPISFILALLSFSSIFTLFIPEHHCSPETHLEGSLLEDWKILNIPKDTGLDATEKFSKCRMYNSTSETDPESNRTTVPCKYGWTFSKDDFERTIATDNNWICDKDFYPTQAFTISSIGMFVGNVVFGPLSDKYGRKPMLFISLMLYMVFAFISFFVPHLYEMYLGVTFFAATGFPMIYSLPPLLMAELCDNEFRAYTFTVSWVAWVFGMAIVPGIAMVSRTWFVLSMSITAPGFLIFFLFPLFPESPRWLVTMGRVDEAAAIMGKIARINKTSHKITNDDLVYVLNKLVQLEKEKEGKVLGFWTLFSTKRLTMITCLIALIWTANSMIYEQITLNTPYMSGNQFLNFFILAVVEMPGSILAGFLIGSLGRRWTPVIFALLMGSVCLVAGAAPQDMSILIIACIMIAKFTVTVTFYVIFAQSTELFPTPLRVTGSAVCSTISTCIGLLSPSIVYTGKIYSGAPYLVMSLLSIVGAIMASFLPETLRQHLPETIEDADDFGRGNKYWSLHPDYDRKKRKSIRRASQISQTSSTLQNIQPVKVQNSHV